MKDQSSEVRTLDRWPPSTTQAHSSSFLRSTFSVQSGFIAAVPRVLCLIVFGAVGVSGEASDDTVFAPPLSNAHETVTIGPSPMVLILYIISVSV